MVQPLEVEPRAEMQDAPLPNGDAVHEENLANPADPAVPAAPPVPAEPADPFAAPAPAPADPAAPAAPAAPRAPPLLRRARPAGLPGPRQRPILPGAQLLGTTSRTCELLFGLMVVEHLCRRAQLQHQRLVRTNWLYRVMLVFVTFASKAAQLMGSCGIAFIGRVIDNSLFNLVARVVNKYPCLKAQPIDMRAATKDFLHGERQKSWMEIGCVIVVFVVLRPLVLALNLFSVCLKAWDSVISQFRIILNDDRRLVEDALGRVAQLFVDKIVALFWRLPFNLFYNWLVIPMVTHPCELAKCVADELQDLLVPDVPGVDGADIDDLPLDEEPAPALDLEQGPEERADPKRPEPVPQPAAA